jgi:hypothetical protein
VSTSSRRGRRPAPARRRPLAVITAAFIIIQQVAFIFPAATTYAQRATVRRTATSAPSDATPPPSNNTAQSLPFSQTWTDTGLITASDNWSGVPGIEGFFLRNDSSSATGVDPQTLTGDTFAGGGAPELSVLANQTSTAITNGDVAEFHTTSQPAPAGTNPTIALQGSGTADAPYILLYLNTTGATSINVSYNLRDIDCTVDNAIQPVALQYRVGSTGSFTNVPAGFVSDATGGNACTAVTAVSAALPAAVDNQPLVQVRIITTNAASNDEWVGVDDISVTGTTSGGGQPSLTVNDVSQDEGNSGQTAFTFTVSLSSSTHGGVTFNIATTDGTAQDDNPDTEDADYVANSSTGVSIPNGQQSAQFTVQVNGDTTGESNETFFVNVSGVSGATVTDSQGQGTIVNDDFTVVPIHAIQGNGTSSPLAGQTVTTTGIVTLLKTGSNAGAGAASGYFLQTPDAAADADPNTSEGIFVFTSTVPTVAVGDEVRVTGTATEFNGLTEITSVSNTSVIDTGNPLPTAVTLDTTILDPTATGQPQLEKYEAMRLTAAALRTVAPNDSFFDVYTVLGAVPRPMREPGIPATDPVPPDPTTGTPDCCIPRWDENPERLKVDTNGRAGSANTPYTSNVTLSNVSGPLDFAFSEYRLITDAAPTASPNMTATAVPLPDSSEFTVASYNIENFNNNATQRQKAALTVRTILRYPDIIGAVEIFDLADLQALRDQINNDAVANGDPNPAYEAYLVEQDGTSEDNDQDVGYLVKTSRVSVTSVTQEREEETYQEPGGATALLHDRPPLVLDATVDPSGASPQRVIVVVNHLRSFIDVELVAGEGPRVREKRKKQAESLAALLNDLQTANAGVPVISVGDYNAYQFNSGYDDSISVIKGNPTPDDQIVVDQSPDLVDPDFYNLIDDLPAAERYSFIFEGTPQALDHHLVNVPARARNTRTTVARVNSDFPENPPATYASNAAVPERNSDHDPVVSYYRLGQVQAAGSVIISEFRFRGPGIPPPPESPVSDGEGDSIGTPAPPVNGDSGGASAPGTSQDNDEFIEFYNDTDSDITVATTDGSAGWALVAADGVTRFIIPNGAVIPARGHYLAVNTDGYSLDSYAVGDITYTAEIPDGSGVALFSTANPANFNAATRLDAAGYEGVDALYREGAGFPAGGGETTSNLEHSFVRKMCDFVGGVGCTTPGTPKDTENNTTDFIVVNTDGASTTLGAKLGAPGPESSGSPKQHNADIAVTLLDPSVSASQPPNRVRDFTQDPANNAQFGKLSIRRTVTNNTGSPVFYLAFRIVEITTYPPPNAGTADLRALDSDDIQVTINETPVDVRGTYVEQPPDQPLGGGMNSSMAVGFVNFEAPLAAGDSVNVQVLLGIQQTGTFRFYIITEALP